jgi:hypothetical protein
MNFLLKPEKVASYLVFMRLLGLHMLQVEFSRPTWQCSCGFIWQKQRGLLNPVTLSSVLKITSDSYLLSPAFYLPIILACLQPISHHHFPIQVSCRLEFPKHPFSCRLETSSNISWAEQHSHSFEAEMLETCFLPAFIFMWNKKASVAITYTRSWESNAVLISGAKVVVSILINQP